VPIGGSGDGEEEKEEDIEGGGVGEIAEEWRSDRVFLLMLSPGD